MKIVLIGNYPLDGQESMSRYPIKLKENLLKSNIEVDIWLPKIFFAYGRKSTVHGFGKWLGHLDKWLLFPIILTIKKYLFSGYSNVNTFFHVCDHSNSPYLQYLPSNRTGITCHDVLAIRGSLGYADTYCTASSTGKFLQKWIFKNLKKANKLTAVSQFTMNQLIDLCKNEMPTHYNWKVIYNTFNNDFMPMEENQRNQMLTKIGVPLNTPFIFNVSSSHPRKNRKMLLDMAFSLGDKWEGLICFAGQPIDDALLQYAEQLGLSNRIVSIVKPDHSTLVALYSSCTAFIFPSFSEGFGWPVIEAQACGAPVIASNVDPMPEIGNNAAIYANPTDPKSFADAFLKLMQGANRDTLIKLGFENCKRFDSFTLTNEFIKLYHS